MYVHFWGTRGSLPYAMTADSARAKIRAALLLWRQEPGTDVDVFIDEKLPFHVRGTYGGNTSCVEIGGCAEPVICDAGTGLRDLGAALAGAAGAGVYNIFMSHLHWDHIQGFPFFTPIFDPGAVINIFGGHKGLREAFTAQQETPFFPVPLKAVRARLNFTTLEPDRLYDIAGCKVRPILQSHPGDSYGYIFERDGKKAVYSTDSEHKSQSDDAGYPFLKHFKDADILILDAQYTLLDAIDKKENWGHSSNLAAVELAVRSGVRRLCLFHNEHTFNDEKLDEFLSNTKKYLRLYAPSSQIEVAVAYDGLSLTL